jgi:uncharacterized membrane protein YfcA
LPDWLTEFWRGATVVDDPWFYAVAVPAVLMTGLAKSGFASGFGSLAVPLMALTLPVPQAAAILLPLLLVMDATGLHQLWRDRDRALVRRLVPWGLAGIGLGWLGFGLLPPKAVAAIVGAMTLAFLAQRLLFRPRAEGTPPRPWLGPACATAAGFTSFVAHAGGPPISAYTLPLKMPPRVLSATLAVFFAAVNLAKWGPYAMLGLIDQRNMATSLLLMPLAPLGVWIGVRLLGRMNPVVFYRVAYTGMLLTGLKLLWDGLR